MSQHLGEVGEPLRDQRVPVVGDHGVSVEAVVTGMRL